MAPSTFHFKDIEINDSILAGKKLANAEPGEEIVIAGISGTFPDSLNIVDFGKNLYNKKDLISTDNRRWDMKHPEIPAGGGRIFDITKFDASFFGVHYKQAQTMDPMGRIILEKTFEALIDAGINPVEMKGTKTSVIVGSCFSESEKTWFYENIQPHGFGVTGCIRSMIANRVSYWLGVNGSSYTVDTACSSSLYALEHGYRSIRMGYCDYAIVGGCNLCLHPYVTLQFARLGVLNKDGKCKCFDETADGYTRAEAVVVVILQKAKDARRVYCKLVHAKTNCDGYKEQGITYPSGQVQTQLLKEFYLECNVNPCDIEYVEAHGTGTKVGDPEELGAIETVFCPKERKTTLLIGSVKSNIGHSEPVSGLCSVAKVILAMETGQLIPNINFSKPRSEIKSLVNGRMKVIQDPIKWNGGYVPVSSFGFGGANCHVLLKSNTKEKINYGAPKDNIPRLVYVSGRTEESIKTFFDFMAEKHLDAEFVGLLHEVFKFDISAHLYRGYAILTKNKMICREMEHYTYEEKPLWFVFSGLGSQWLGMAEDLMQIPVFAGTIEKCQQILKSKGVNLTDILIQKDPFLYAKQTNVLIAITAMQIAFVDLLNFIDIKPAGVFGYSIGEIASGYFDGCLTLEQALLSAYYLGQASDHCQNGIGSIVSIQINYKNIKDVLIPGLEIACINSETNSYISGPTNKIKEFIQLMKDKDVPCEEIDTKLAFHSNYVKDIADSVVKYLKSVIPEPKQRSEKWISANSSKLCSAEFLSKILVNPINLLDNFNVVPSNAIILEVSPQGLLQKSLKRSVYDNSVTISLFNKDANAAQVMLSAIGKLYNVGCNPRMERIYPKISYPVSRGTPMISHLVKWDHSYDWFVTKFEVQDKIKSGERLITVKLNDEDQEYIAGHCIDGRVLYPATGYLNLVWETIGLVRKTLYTDLPIVFENVKFLRATNVPKEGRVYLIVMVQKVSGNFEIIESGNAIVTGRVYVPKDEDEFIEVAPIVPEKRDYYVSLSKRDIYKELRLRGYNYSGLFRGLKSCDPTASVGEVEWNNNWVAFMDTILQMQILQEDTRGLFVPVSIQRLAINTKKHKEIIQSLKEDESVIPVYAYKHLKLITCGGVQICGLDASAIARKKILGVPVLEKFEFVPNVIENCNFSLEQSVRILLHIALENILGNKVKTSEIVEDNFSSNSQFISPIILDSLADLPLKQPDVNILSNKQIEVNGVTVSDKKIISETGCVLVIGTNILQRGQILQAAFNATIKGGFVLARENLNLNLAEIDLNNVCVMADHHLKSERLILLTKMSDTKLKSFVDVTDTENTFDWIPLLQNTLQKDPNTCIYAQGDDCNGILGFSNCLRREPGFENTSCVFIMDKNAPPFNPNDVFYADQLKKQFSQSVYKNGKWGTYRHLLLEEAKPIDAEYGYVNVTVRGDLSSLRWLEGNLTKNMKVENNKVLAYVYYSAMNFRDIMTATGRIAPEFVAKGRFDQDCVQGLEFSGRLPNGRRVMGMLPNKSMATLVQVDPLFLWEFPDHWSMADAATVPVTYATVMYALFNQGKLQKGMSILIHSGTGGVGQAAINIALHHGCTVYTTVGTQEKREYIKKTWPQIKDNQIGNSHDTSFEEMIMRETKGRGVDMVLNSLAEEKLLASTRCVAEGGKFFEIGKFDLSKDNPLPLNFFRKDISFHGIMLDAMFNNRTTHVKKCLFNLIKEGLKNNSIKPLNKFIFNENEIEEMFRFMATGKHMGKVLLKIREEEPQLQIEPYVRTIKAYPRYYATGTGSYIITGGLGGFGLELCDWLVLRGVRKLVLTSRRGISTGYQAMRIKIWKSYGVKIIISTADITTYNGCKSVIQQAMELGPIEAIFNLAVILKDAMFANLTKEEYQISFGPKAISTKYFDQLTREYCPDLKQFVIFSSVVAGRGNPGQTNYGMANSVMERICEKRQEDGLPALAVEWGAVGDVGLVAELQEDDTELVIGGTLQQRITNCLHVLDQFLRQKNPIVASMLVAEKRANEGAASNIIDAVVNILGIRDIKTVSIHSSLAELGMDSIMAVEIKQTLERDFDVYLTPQDIRAMTFARLHEIAAEKQSEDVSEKKEDDETQEAVIPEMGMYFIQRAIGDEESSSKPLITLPSKAKPGTKDRVILLPGIEGMGSVLETLASNLRAEVVCLQLGYTTSYSTIPEMASGLLDRALANILDPKSGFTLVGYSYGSAIVLELAALLEAKGITGKIVLIDGAPEMLKQMAKEQISANNELEFQNQVLRVIVNNILSAEMTNQLLQTVQQFSTWEEKIDILLKYKPENSQYTEIHHKNVCNAIYNRLKAILNYEPQLPKLQSKIKLLKPLQQSVTMEEEDFGLSKFSLQPVDIEYIEGNHVLIVENIKCAEEINNLLQNLETFEKNTFTTIKQVKKEVTNM